jgi:hypothetical protein
MTTSVLTQTTAATTTTPLAPQRLRAAKAAYTTRYLSASVDADPTGFALLTGDAVAPRSGDVVLARVVEIGKHTRLESPVSRRQLLFPGDEVLVSYGARYAPDQFLAEVPADLGPCHLVAAGGVAGRVVEQHAAIDDATALEPVGLLATADGRRVTLADQAPYAVGVPGSSHAPRPRVVAVLGTSMNSGKSTTLAHLVHGLTASGHVVSAGKATGTGAGGDPHLFRDAGATRVLDFTDFGHPSTYRLDHDAVRRLWTALVDQLSLDGPGVVVVEVADGLFQGETARLLAHPDFAGRVDAVVFAAQDALGAAAGVGELRRLGLPVVGVSGLLTASPLAAGEARAALESTGVPVVPTTDLSTAEGATGLLG